MNQVREGILEEESEGLVEQRRMGIGGGRKSEGMRKSGKWKERTVQERTSKRTK